MMSIDLSKKTERPLKLFFSYPHRQSEICQDIYVAIYNRKMTRKGNKTQGTALET